MTETGFWVAMIVLPAGFAILAAVSDGAEWAIRKIRGRRNR